MISTVKLDYFSLVPKAILVSVASQLDNGDRNTLACVQVAFRKALSARHIAASDRAKILLSQVVGCKRLTSIKTLYKQLEDLKQLCPNYLGENKPWTAAEVLKQYSLKEIDFSQEDVSLDQVGTLLQTFSQIAKESPPVGKQMIERQPSPDGYHASFLFEMGKDELLVLNSYARLIPEETALSLDLDSLRTKMIFAFLDLPWMKFIQTLQGYLLVRGQVVNFIQEAHMRETWGDIEVVDLGIHNPPMDAQLSALKIFMNLFCPKLKVLRLHLQEASNLRFLHFFFLSPERNHALTHACLFRRESIERDIYFPHTKFLNLQKNIVQGTERMAMTELESIRALSDSCPHIQEVCLNSFRITDENEHLYVQEISRLAKSCPNITQLELLNFSSAQLAGAFSFISTAFPKLQKLAFSNFPNMAANGVPVRISCEALLMFLSKCPHLQSLRIEGPAFDFEINDLFFHCLPMRQPRLEQLELRCDYSKANTTFYSCLAALPHLTSLYFSNPQNHWKKLKICRLRKLVRQLELGEVHSRKFFQELSDEENWDILNDIHRILSLFNKGYEPNKLRDNLHLLRETFPFYSVRTNILSQVTTHFLHTSAIESYDSRIDNVAKCISALRTSAPILDDFNIMTKHSALGQALVKVFSKMRNGNGDPLVTLERLATVERTPEEVQAALPIFENYQTILKNSRNLINASRVYEMLTAITMQVHFNNALVAKELFEKLPKTTNQNIRKLLKEKGLSGQIGPIIQGHARTLLECINSYLELRINLLNKAPEQTKRKAESVMGKAR